MSKYKERAKKFGVLRLDTPGFWAQADLQFPDCGTQESVDVEYDASEEGGAARTPVVCKICGALFLFSYETSVQLDIERRT